MEDFGFEMEYAEMTNDTDRAHVAVMNRFPEFRPVDMSRFGGWDEPWFEMLDAQDFPAPSCPEGRDCMEDCWATEF